MRSGLWLAVFLIFAFAGQLYAQDVPTAKEVHPGITVEPTVLTARDGTRLRAVVTKPDGSRGRLPAILYVQWLSCDTIAIPATPSSGWDLMLQRLVRETWALVWRVDNAVSAEAMGNALNPQTSGELIVRHAAPNLLSSHRSEPKARGQAGVHLANLRGTDL